MISDFTFESDPFELRELATSVRRFAESELTAPSFQRHNFEQMGSLGLSGMTASEEAGGTDLDSLSIAATMFEIARAQLGPAVYLSVHLMVLKLLRKWANHDIHLPLMKQLASAQKLAAFCLTEPRAGSDASALSTRAERKGDGWVLSGEKTYITSAGLADIYVVFAKTGAKDSKEISAFLVEKNNKGISFGAPEKKMGAEGSPIASVHLDSCVVNESALLGAEGDGYRIALSGLNAGRISMAACACGLASKSIELARAHAIERSQFGQKIAEFQGIRFMLADMASKLFAATLLTREAARRLDTGGKENWPASVAKCFASDAAMNITTDGVQVLGGAGYLVDYKVEQLMRDAKMLQIVEGTNQIQRLLISRALFEEIGWSPPR